MFPDNPGRWLSGLLHQNRGKKILFQVEDADRYAAAGNYERSRSTYQDVIRYLEKKKGRTPEETELFGRAYLGLGNVELSIDSKDSAFQSFVRADACGYTLPDRALIALAEGFARENRGDDAAEYYIRYTGLRKPPEGQAKRIYALLERCCYIDEKSDRSRTDAAIALNRKVIAANPAIDWAHYYLGMGYYLAGDEQNAEHCFDQAITINPYWRSRQYYLGQAYLKQGNLDSALSTLRIAVLKEPENADASFLVGKILIDQVEKDAC